MKLIVGTALALALFGQEPEETGVFYVVDGSALRATETQTAEQQIGRSGMTATIAAVLKGVRSGIRVAARPDLQFALKPAPGQDIARYQLLQFVARADSRSVTMSVSGRGTKLSEGRQITLRAQKQGAVYRITPAENLTPGEYGFSDGMSPGVHTFGVDPPGTVAAAPNSTERLQKLDQLLKAGLITKQDYDKKRAEIQPEQAGPASAEERLKRLETLLKQNLITRQEYDSKRAEILAEI